jgi:hypothetical protein
MADTRLEAALERIKEQEKLMAQQPKSKPAPKGPDKK